MFIKKLPPKERLNNLFVYNARTGQVSRKKHVRGISFSSVGIVKTKTDIGYLRVQIDGKRHRLHRVIWKLYYGDFDESLQIDHINGNRSDNRIENLRAIEHGVNNKNTKMFAHNTSGKMGVTWNKRSKKWSAYIGGKKTRIHLGNYPSFNEAKKVRELAEKKYRYHHNHGRTI